MTDPTDAYDLFASPPAVDLPTGTSLLVTAAQPAGREFIVSSLAHGIDTGGDALVLTADDPAGTVGDELRAAATVPADAATDPIRIIDCQTDGLGVDDDSMVDRDVNTPRNLTDIGIAFKDAFDRFDRQGVDRVRFGLLSLSIILSYVDQETVYRFCQTLTRGLANEGALGLFALNDNAHDEETIATLKRAFDGVAEVDASGEELSVRITGLDGVTDDWVTVSA